jgi:hypothetical protein
MPTSLFDPRWAEPTVAAHVAWMLYCRTTFPKDGQPGDALVATPPEVPPGKADARRFALVIEHPLSSGQFGAATRMKGGSSSR